MMKTYSVNAYIKILNDGCSERPFFIFTFTRQIKSQTKEAAYADFQMKYPNSIILGCIEE